MSSLRPEPVAADCWPTPLQELLLEVGLRTGDARLRALTRLGARLGQATPPPEALRLLPLAGRGAREAGAEASAWMSAAEAVYLRTWQRAERAAPLAARALRALAGAAIPSLVLKGWALSDVYGDPALRPASDLDLLVPAPCFQAAAAVLEAAGWSAQGSPDPLAHARAFTSPGLDVDLHQHALEEFVGTAHDQALWAQAVPFTLAGEPTRALCAVDQVLHACVHGLRWAPSPAVHWVADAVLGSRAQGTAFDWESLAARAEVLDLVLPLRVGLGYLAERFDLVVPAAILRRLRAVPVPWSRRLAFAARQLAPGRRGVLHSWAVRHELRARARRAGVRPVPGGPGAAGARRALRVSLAKLSGRR